VEIVITEECSAADQGTNEVFETPGYSVPADKFDIKPASSVLWFLVFMTAFGEVKFFLQGG